jgi:hypothetical protein
MDAAQPGVEPDPTGQSPNNIRDSSPADIRKQPPGNQRSPAAGEDAEVADEDAEVADEDAEVLDEDAEVAEVGDEDAEVSDEDAEFADEDAEVGDEDAEVVHDDAETADGGAGSVEEALDGHQDNSKQAESDTDASAGEPPDDEDHGGVRRAFGVEEADDDGELPALW